MAGRRLAIERVTGTAAVGLEHHLKRVYRICFLGCTDYMRCRLFLRCSRCLSLCQSVLSRGLNRRRRVQCTPCARGHSVQPLSNAFDHLFQIRLEPICEVIFLTMRYLYYLPPYRSQIILLLFLEFTSLLFQHITVSSSCYFTFLITHIPLQFLTHSCNYKYTQQCTGQSCSHVEQLFYPKIYYHHSTNTHSARRSGG